jgi:membrane-associated phospholipid phosphatase
LTIITLIWKISLHAATMTAMVTILVLFSGSIFLWFYLFLIPIIWARLVLKQHTPAQLGAGIALGVSVTLVAYKVFGG